MMGSLQNWIFKKTGVFLLTLYKSDPNKGFENIEISEE